MSDGLPEGFSKNKAELSEKLRHVKPEPKNTPSGQLRCPDCNTSEFRIMVPPEYTPPENYFSYVICAKCGKLWKIRIMNIRGVNDPVQYLGKGRLEPMKT